MESLEDDAGTATNASRRASAREKDVGLAEDVNATSSFQQKPSEARISCQTPATSEENFDGDSVPSPSSQDVNTSTEAILDMIDEIVDGPSAPKRLQHTSKVVDALNEEFATTSYNLNIVQQATISDENLSTLHQETIHVNNIETNEESVISAATETIADYSTPCDVPTSHPVNDSVDFLPATSTASESHENVVPMESVSMAVSNSYSSCPLPNIPSSSEEQAVQNVSESVSEGLDRTIKCVSSSDNRDNVTVESAESTSSDSSVSESKALHFESPTRSPLRRRLVRPLPSDRRPDYTVSSTVDSHNPTTEHTTSCENITKDVTSSSDAVPIIHGNVKPEEIRNVSEINFCQAETSMSPPKKIKLIRQKTVTGVSSKEFSQNTSGLTEKDPCQSTSADSHSSPIPITSSKTLNLSQLEEGGVNPIMDSNSVLEKSPDSPVKRNDEVCPIEHSQPSIEPCKFSYQDDSNIQVIVQESSSIPNVSSPITSDSLEIDISTSVTEQVDISPTRSSPKHMVNLNMNYLEQGNVCNTHDKENRQLDYIPLCVSPKKDECLSQSSQSELIDKDSSSNTELESKKLKSHKSELETKSTKCELEPSTFELKSNECKGTKLESTSISPESVSCDLESISHKVESDISKPLNVENDLSGSKSLSKTSEHVAMKIENELNELHSINSISEEKNNEQNSNSLGIELENSKPDSSSSEISSKGNKVDLKTDLVKSQPEVLEKCAPTELKNEELVSSNNECKSHLSIPENCESDVNEPQQEDQKKVPPIKLNLSRTSISGTSESKVDIEHSSFIKNNIKQDELDANKQVPKLTIKLKQTEELKSPVGKISNKSLRHPVQQDEDEKIDSNQQRRSVTKLNIKPIIKPVENVNDKQKKSQTECDNRNATESSEQVPFITKLNIKRIHKPPERINDIHRKSSSSEISESEYSENDETTSTSDQASASDNGSTEVVPKVTIKLGKPGTESEGKFYTEKNVPKLTIKGIQQDEKVIISQSEDIQSEKIPKLTIKTVAKTESQPLSPKLTIKPLKPPDSPKLENEIPKMKITAESFSSPEGKEGPHVPKFTIKAVTRMDCENRTSRKSSAMSDSQENIPVVTKINIKPILKPTDIEELSDDKVPVVSKLNIKPLIKPKDNDVDSSIDDVPKITKLNIKPIKNPEENSSEHKDCDDLNADIDKNSIPVVTKINIKPIVKPQGEEKEKYSENLSSETGNSSDDNTDHIPVVTKLNIKPVVKPDTMQESGKSLTPCEQSIPVVTKLNIKPLVKPGESSPSSPKKEHSKIDVHSTSIPVISKLNIKPIMRPEEAESSKVKDINEEKSVKNPPLVMKINMKSVTENFNHEISGTENINKCVSDGLLNISPKISKIANEDKLLENKTFDCEKLNDNLDKRSFGHSPVEQALKQNCVPDVIKKDEDIEHKLSVSKKPNLRTFSKSKSDILATQHSPKLTIVARCDSIHTASSVHDPNALKESKITASAIHKSPDQQTHDNVRSVEITESSVKPSFSQQKNSSLQNCTLLKQLLENTRDSFDKKPEINKVVNCSSLSDESESTLSTCKNIVNSEHLVESAKSSSNKIIISRSSEGKLDKSLEKINDLNKSESSILLQELKETVPESVTKPLEIVIADKIPNQDSGQDSPRIILKINKTDHGPSAKIITEDIKRTDILHNYVENTPDNLNEKLSPKKHLVNSRRKQTSDTPIPSLNLSTGKRLRSSRIVENTDKSQTKKNISKRSSPPHNKEPELSPLQTKRLKLSQLLSGGNALTESPIQSMQTSPTKILEPKSIESKPTVNHSILNSENCSKNGNSKLHNILSNLQAKQMHSLGLINSNSPEKATIAPNIDDTSISSSDVVDVPHMENSHPELQHMIINENADFRDLSAPEDTSQDPLEVESLKHTELVADIIDIPKPVVLTPQPKKRGRPRKLPVSEGTKPAVVTLPVPALEERPQRSLRLMRDRPTVLHKPRGRGRGRGSRRGTEVKSLTETESITIVNLDQPGGTPSGEIDPMSSRIKLPRMTEALDKMPSTCTTPLSSRRRNSSGNFSIGESPALKSMLDNSNDFPNTPEPSGLGRGRGGRGSRGGRGRTPRGRGRGRGGGRGAMYMKETMGIYGRVCGPATTTVQLFEEETCMMDDNATPASSRPSHLLDDDSQSSVKSSTNDSNKMKKSKFADLFDSNKVWTAADVKEYTWPPPEKSDEEHTVMMIQEQVAMFLGVKSFKRRYPELKRRTIVGDERKYVLSKGLVTEALCDLGITAVDASDVLDIMLSDYPHKYEEFRSHQRERQLEVSEEVVEESKPEEKIKMEVKLERIEQKSEIPKIDPEKTRQDMAAAAIASASEFNARVNASRRAACVDLQSLTVLRPRAPPVAPSKPHLRPPAGFYPHALLPGQYQHSYRIYTPEQLRYFPLNTVLAAPPAPASITESSSDSEPEWGSRYSSSDDSDVPTHHSTKRKKLTKVKRVSQVESTTSIVKEESRDEVADTCRVCKLRLEANRKYTHERFLVCANCNAKLHPACVELNADTIRKCREYPWQCAECKTCCSCHLPADDDKMLFCDLCDRGFHIYCVGLDNVPGGRWHCVECAICKSCGARSPSGIEAGSGAGPSTSGGAGPGASGAAGPGAPPADWHHQTKRGPGGHKVYSHSLCTPCARAYRIGRYCPLCERSFIGPKGTMQLVICKLCDRQLHQECVKQSGAALRVMDYTCAECRRGGITSRAAAVRLAPRTIATLFMAKRRFNKYAHRQYMESRLRAGAPDPPDHSNDLSADAPDLSVDAPDLSTDTPDLSEDAPDLSADGHE